MERENNGAELLKDRPYKAYVGAAIPFVAMFLTWYATGEFNVEEFVMLATSLLSGGGVYATSNKPEGRNTSRRA